MLHLKKFLFMFILMLCLTGCQEKQSNLDTTKLPEIAYSQVSDFKGYKIDSVYYYQGEHLNVNGESFGKAMVVRTIIKHYDVFKDSKKHEVIAVLSDQEHNYFGQEYICDDSDILISVEKWEVLDANRPVKYIKAMSDSEIQNINSKLDIIK